MAYTGRSPWGRSDYSVKNSRLYRENHGWKPQGSWWMKLLATVIAILVIVGVLALVSSGEIFKIFTELNWL